MTAKWHILGAGSLGILWATRLHVSTVPVSLILRDDSALENYRQAGALTLGQDGRTSGHAVPAELGDSENLIETLLVACKAYDAVQAVASIAHRLHAQSTVILLQNGLGSQKDARLQAPQAHFIYASTTEGAYRITPHHAVFAGTGHTWLGDDAGGAPPPCLNALNTAGIPYTWSTTIHARLWHKLAINCAINPLTVILDCHNGALLSQNKRLRPLIQELAALLSVNGLPISTDVLHEEILDVCRRTAENSSSMRQDAAAGRRTELTPILGFACTAARQAGLAIPHLQALLNQTRKVLQTRGLPDT